MGKASQICFRYGWREFLVVLFVHEANNVVQNEDAFDGVAHGLVLGLEPVNDKMGAERQEFVGPFRFLHQIDHEIRRAAHEAGCAHRAARGHQGQDFAGVQDALPLHSDAVKSHRHKGVVLHFIFREVLDVLDMIEGVVFAGRVVLPEFDLGAKRRWLRRHAVFHPPGRHPDDVGKFLVDFQVRLEPHLRIEIIIHVFDAQIAGYPGAVHDHGHRHLVQFFKARRPLECIPLFRPHVCVRFKL